MPESPAFPFLRTAWPPLCTCHPQVVHKAPGGVPLVAEALPMPTALFGGAPLCGSAGYPAGTRPLQVPVHSELSDPAVPPVRRQFFCSKFGKPAMLLWGSYGEVRLRGDGCDW